MVGATDEDDALLLNISKYAFCSPEQPPGEDIVIVSFGDNDCNPRSWMKAQH